MIDQTVIIIINVPIYTNGTDNNTCFLWMCAHELLSDSSEVHVAHTGQKGVFIWVYKLRAGRHIGKRATMTTCIDLVVAG